MSLRTRRLSALIRPRQPVLLPVLLIACILLTVIGAALAGDPHDHGPGGCGGCAAATSTDGRATGFPRLEVSAGPVASSSIVCTVFPVYALACELASGSGRPVDLLLPANLGCPHHYTLTPGDFERLGKAGTIVTNGLGFEPFLDRVTRNLDGIPRVDCASGLPTIPSVEDPAAPNAHLFTTPSGCRAMAGRLAEELASQDRIHAEVYSANLQALSAALERQEASLRALGVKLASVPVVLTHDSLDYLARALGLKIVAHLVTSEGGSISAGELAAIVQAVKRERPAAILIEGSETPPLAESLIRETGISPVHLELLTQGPTVIESGFIDRHFTTLLEQFQRLLPTP